MATTTPQTPQVPRPPTKLPATPPPGFATPEKRGRSVGSKK
jgi:hypothetical protein